MSPQKPLSLTARLLLHSFRTRQENEKQDERSIGGKIAAGLGTAAVLGGFYAYGRSRPSAVKARAGLRQDQYVAGLTRQAAPTSVPVYNDGGFNYGVKPAAAPQLIKQTVKAKAPAAKTQSLLRPGEKGPLSSWQAERRNKIAIAAKKTATVKVGLKARILLTQFQYRNPDGSYNVSTNPLSAYRKASRIVPWVRRGSEAAGDIGDMASGKEVKDPFYKKPWFKRAALTAAVAAPVLAANLAHVGSVKQAHGLKPRTGNGVADRVDRLTHSAADVKKKIQTATGLSAGLFGSADRPTIMLSRREPSAVTLSRKPNKLLVALAAHERFSAFAHAVRKRLVEVNTTHDFAYADALDKGWDVRDARGRSARVYAPGAQRRDRREKTWGEKVDSLRLMRNAAIAGVVVGGVTTGVLGSKLRKANAALKPKVVAPAAPSNIVQFPGRKVMASAKLAHLVQFKKKDAPALRRIIDSASDKIELPNRPEIPGEGAVRFVMARPALRHPFLRAVGATGVAGTGLLVGAALKKPKTGALIGGIGAGLILK